MSMDATSRVMRMQGITATQFRLLMLLAEYTGLGEFTAPVAMLAYRCEIPPEDIRSTLRDLHHRNVITLIDGVDGTRVTGSINP